MSDRDVQGNEERGVTPKMVVSAVLLVAVIAFVLDNTDKVQIGYVFGESDIPLIIVLLVVLVVGMFVGYVAGRRRD
jgi:lipopolysaccharide assembly protein A